ncbi:MAG: oligosaccharide flippase family protein [Chitinophagales bacterium]|nr:oligosaccharide flippase family protein [Chitinophagales bacterium]
MDSILKSVSVKNVREWLTGRHARELLLVFSLQAASLIASLLLSLLITNMLGAAAYGIFSYGFSWVNLLAVFSCMGFEQLALKELPAYRVQGKSELIRGYFQYATRRIIIVSTVVSILFFLLSYFLHQPGDEMLRTGLWLALTALPLTAMLNLRFSWLRSFQFNTLSQFPDKLLRPVLLLILIGTGFLFFSEYINAFVLIVMSVASILVALLAGEYFVRRKVLQAVSTATPLFDKANWNRIALSLFMVNGIYYYLSQVQLLILGSFRGASEAGVYAIAARLSDLEGYMLFALNVVMAPLISKLFAEGKKAELQSVMTRSLWFGLLFSLPLIFCFLFFPVFFLSLFGDEFGDGSLVLVLLTISQVVNFATGSVGYLLTMTGHQKTAIQLLLLCALLTTLLCFLLVPVWGKEGAAIAAAVNNIVLNIAMSIAVFRKTGINSTLFRIR